MSLANAECLAGLVIHQLAAPGAPFIYGGCASALDMKTMVYAYASPEWSLADMVYSQLSRRYNLPVFGTGGASNAKTVDGQAGAEWAFSLLFSALAGTNLIHDVGYMGCGLAGSLEALVICDDTIGMVKRALAGFGMGEEDFAAEVISHVGPGGSFIGEDHTLGRYRRDVWYPSLFERGSFEAWTAAGAKDTWDRASQRVKELLA